MDYITFNEVDMIKELSFYIKAYKKLKNLTFITYQA